MDMHPKTARIFWKALIDNASALVTDAHVLLERGSHGRARALTVLAQEELGKALWIYETFEHAWTSGASETREAARLTSHGRHHVAKYMTAFVFGQDLAAFWGDDGANDHPLEDTPEGWEAFSAKRRSDAEAAGRQANAEKMAGLYVDLDEADAAVSSPASIPAGAIGADLQTAAQVIEMLLIKDHSRMKFDAQTPYDSTHLQQHRLLPISHPEEWAEASDEFKRGI